MPPESVPPRVPERVHCPQCNGTGMLETNTTPIPGMKYVMAPRGYCRMCGGVGFIDADPVEYAPVSSGVDEEPAPCGRRFSIRGCEWPRCADGEACQYASEEGCPVSGVGEERATDVLVNALLGMELRHSDGDPLIDSDHLTEACARVVDEIKAALSVSREPSPSVPDEDEHGIGTKWWQGVPSDPTVRVSEVVEALDELHRDVMIQTRSVEAAKKLIVRRFGSPPANNEGEQR